jgi:p-hydroxybenzoate 3-monooxygenase
MRADVLIVGAGPAGLLLGHSLIQAGIDTLVVERQSATHVQSRIRAGVLERTTTGLMVRLGLVDRLHREGLRHDGFQLACDGRLIRIDLAELTGAGVTVYGQTELTRDLMDAAGPRGLGVLYDTPVITLGGLDGNAPVAEVERGGARETIRARVIVGCDGYHGACRRALPDGAGRSFERVYPFGWLGILADVPPCSAELIYASSERGFALASMRSATRSRYYIDVPAGERLEEWPDDRLWDELALRLGPDAAAHMTRGPAIETSIAPLRSFVFEPMRLGSLYLCGDAAHIVPPTGAKGLNLAASDVTYLAEALIALFHQGERAGVDGYSARALARVWKAERFSWSLTRLLHRFPADGAFERRMQQAELDFIANSRAAQTAIAENYIGLPL